MRPSSRRRYVLQNSWMIAATFLAAASVGHPRMASAQGARAVPSVSGPIAGNDATNHPFNAASYQAVPIDLGAHGYVENEYFVSGIANVYQYHDVTLATDRAVTVLRSGPYTNRILVRKPADPAHFSGNVIVELLNATNNYDLPVFWSYDHDQFLARGDIWIGITSKPVAIAGLKKFNPARYAALSWANPDPSQNATTCPVLQSIVGGASYATEDGLLWDVLSQTASLVRSRSPDNPLHGYAVRAVLAAGYSQSAIDLVSYINAITPRISGGPIFDGYLVGSGFGIQAPLNQCSPAPAAGDPRNILRSRNAPIIATQSQTDYRNARVAFRADSDAPNDRYRYEEAAGPAHVVLDQLVSDANAADTHAAGGTTLAEDFTTCTPTGITLSAFPGHYLLDSAFDQLEGWVRQGRTPPHAPLIQATGTPPSLVTVLDAHGNAVGGVRAPELDVPVATYTESSGGASLNCSLSGHEVDFSPQTLETLYPSKIDYVGRFVADALKIRAQGFLTDADAIQSALGAIARPVP